MQATVAPVHAEDDAENSDLIEFVELLFFAYRDFTSDPDAILSEYGFGRAHHRVLHFVNRNAGMRVTDLLDILKITKQSLARVLRQLVDLGFIEQRAGSEDRRERLLYPTQAGKLLAARLATPQLERIGDALGAFDPKARAAARSFLYNLVNAGERKKVERIVATQSVVARR